MIARAQPLPPLEVTAGDATVPQDAAEAVAALLLAAVEGEAHAEGDAATGGKSSMEATR